MDQDEGDDFDPMEILTDVAEIEEQVNVQLVMMRMMIRERWRMKVYLLISMASINVPDVLNRNQEIRNELLDLGILSTE